VRRYSRPTEILIWLVSATALLLVLLGWLRHPSISLLSGLAAGIVLALYAWAGSRMALRFDGDDRASRLALRSGLLAGLIFAAEIPLEYAFLPKDNNSFGLIEFGSVFAIYAAVGAINAIRAQPLRDAITGVVIAAVISSLLWCITLLTLFYLFEGTARQASVLLSEGDFDDFRRSGMTSFATFMVEDLFGAVFFHLLLAPFIAMILTSVSWLAGTSLRSAFRRLSPR
jgi:hypothetical protein